MQAPPRQETAAVAPARPASRRRVSRRVLHRGAWLIVDLTAVATCAVLFLKAFT